MDSKKKNNFAPRFTNVTLITLSQIKYNINRPTY